MKHERGGAATAPWLVGMLLAAALLSAAMNLYLSRHRTITVQCSRGMMPVSEHSPFLQRVYPKVKPFDYQKEWGEVHIFPDDGGEVCTFVNYQCWTTI